MQRTDEYGNPIGDDDHYEEHTHEVKSPITEAFARERLLSFSLSQLHEVAIADGLPIVGNRRGQIKAILVSWFSPTHGIGGRVVSFQELLNQAEHLPQHERRVWRKNTYGKDLGIKITRLGQS